jgi:erythromycin esterase-like protein
MSPLGIGTSNSASISKLLREVGEPFDAIENLPLGPLLERIGHARVVLLGEASHGTSEFYRMRARITQELIPHHRFSIVAVEADWPDAAGVTAAHTSMPITLTSVRS